MRLAAIGASTACASVFTMTSSLVALMMIMMISITGVVSAQQVVVGGGGGCKIDGDTFDNGAVDGDLDYNSNPSPREIPSRQQIIDMMNLKPHPDGGFYRNVSTTPDAWVYSDADIADGQDKRQPAMDVVEFMLTPKTELLPNPADFGFDAYKGITGRSYFHKLTHEEQWTFLHGDTVYLFELDNAAENDVKITTLGVDLDAGQVPQYTVPAETWFAAIVNPRSIMEEPYSVLSAVVAPGYEHILYGREWQAGEIDALLYQFPNAEPWIREMTFPDLVNELIDVDKAYAEAGVSSLCKTKAGHPSVDELRSFFNMQESPYGSPQSNYYSQAYTSQQDVLAEIGTRKALTSTYFVMNSTMAWHRTKSDQIWSFHFGDSIVIYEIMSENNDNDDVRKRRNRNLQSMMVSNGRVMKATPLGLDVTQGEVSQYLVKANTWFGVEHKDPIQFVNVTNTTLLEEWENYFLMGLDASDQRMIDLTEHQDYEIVYNHTIEANYTNSSWFLVQNTTRHAFMSVTNAPGMSPADDLEVGDLDMLSNEFSEFNETLFEIHLRSVFEAKWGRGEIESAGPMVNWTEADLQVNGDSVDFEVALSTSQAQTQKSTNKAGIALGIVAMALVALITLAIIGKRRRRNSNEKQLELKEQESEIEHGTPPVTPMPQPQCLSTPEPQCSVVLERNDGSYEAVRRHSFLKSFSIDQTGQISSRMPEETKRRGYDMRIGDELEDPVMQPYGDL
mmetsp:Transcript_31064/g.75077  ORF Transcript_31064/g.75077 Transcript_31064/m.75077 type:complete len:732 (+) Transcript_31064:74-2269(+)